MADEKYRLQLEGSQVDDALLQMNQRIPEGWAVGTRDGSPVGPGSQFYQNNAKYYAEQAGGSLEAANAAAARAEAAVPAGTEGAVLFTVDQSDIMTEAQKAVVRKNIRAANTNPNLLRNWYFVNPVNSRGKSAYTVNNTQYSIDGWNGVNATSTHTLQNGEIVVSSSGFSVLGQELDNAPAGTYTLSLQTGSIGNSVVFYILDTNENAYSQTINLNPYTFGSFVFTTSAPIKNIRFFCGNGATFSARQAKLEVGTVSTLAQDAPPSYGEELTKCIYAKADLNDPYANTGFGRSNRNYLDNWYFVGGGSQYGRQFPINQYGAASYTASSVNGRTIDRWVIASPTITVTPRSWGIELAGSGGENFSQVIDAEVAKDLWGKTVTGSLLLADGTFLKGTTVFPTQPPSGGGWSFSAMFYDAHCNLIVGVSETGRTEFFVQLSSTSPIAIEKVKLELGAVSTLLFDTAPNYNDVLSKCQQYLWVETWAANTPIASGIAFNTSSVFDFITPVQMHSGSIYINFSVTPYITYGTGNLALAGGSSSVTSGKNGNHLRLQIGHQNNADLGNLTEVHLLCGQDTVMYVANEL